MRGYDRKNPDGYPSVDYDKRQRHTYRQNRYQNSNDEYEQRRKSMRLRIKRNPKLLESNADRAIIRTTYARRATGKKGVITKSVPTDEMRDEFFRLLECNFFAIKNYFNKKEKIHLKLGNIEDEILEITGDHIEKLMGMENRDETGILSYKSPISQCGFEKWRVLSKLERLEQLVTNKDLITKFEKNNGVRINYLKAKDKNKSLFIFDLFNLKKKQVYAKKMNQKEVNESYGKYYDPKDEEKFDYIMLERKKKIEGKNRYVTIMFRRKLEEQDLKVPYCPISIIETKEPILSITGKNLTTIEQVSPICILDTVKTFIKRGGTRQDINNSKGAEKIRKETKKGKGISDE